MLTSLFKRLGQLAALAVVLVTMTGSWEPLPDVTQSGAACDGVTDDTVAIQKAVNIPGRAFVVIPAGRTCIISPQTNPPVSNQFGANSVALYPVSNQTWYIYGTLKVKAGSSAISGAMIGNWQANLLSNLVFTGGGVLDGNFPNAPSAQMTSIVAANCTNCRMENLTSLNSGFIGFQFSANGTEPPTTTQPVNVAFRNLTVTNSAFICLALQYPSTFEVASNVLTSCGDNGVDIFGDNAVTSGIGLTFLGKVHDNLINNVVGASIFLESVSNVDVEDNWLGTQSHGEPAIYLNRIHTDQRNSIIAGNHMTTAAGVAGTQAIVLQNSSGTDNIYGNFFDGYESGIHCFAGGCRFVYIHGNFYSNIGKDKLKVDTGTGQLFFSSVTQEYDATSRSATTGYPFTASPLSNSGNSPSRSIDSIVLPDFFTSGSLISTSLQAEYLDGHAGTLSTSCPGFSGVALFDGPPFGTVICDMSGTILQGRPIIINGIQYIVGGSPGPNQYSVGAGCVPNTGSQDFAAGINSTGPPYTWQEYFPAWCTD